MDLLTAKKSRLKAYSDLLMRVKNLSHGLNSKSGRTTRFLRVFMA
jgi:hypothetical protein